VRRTKPAPGSQLALLATYSYHAMIANRPGLMISIEADHRRHAEIENTIRDLKYGVGLNHLPSGRFGANAAWLALNVIAHNIARWTSRIGLGETIIATDTPCAAATCASPADSPPRRVGASADHAPPRTLDLGGGFHRRSRQHPRHPTPALNNPAPDDAAQHRGRAIEQKTTARTTGSTRMASEPGHARTPLKAETPTATRYTTSATISPRLRWIRAKQADTSPRVPSRSRRAIYASEVHFGRFSPNGGSLSRASQGQGQHRLTLLASQRAYTTPATRTICPFPFVEVISTRSHPIGEGRRLDIFACRPLFHIAARQLVWIL
jgi:hypothetical protein